MLSCEIPNEDLLPSPVVHLQIEDPNCDFDCAFAAAYDRAEQYCNTPELLSWYDKNSQSHFPRGECCLEGEPSWVAFAEGNKAELTVNINDEEYVFIFREEQRKST